MLRVFSAAFFSILFSVQAFAIPQYYCTAANDAFFDRLYNLIGSIHATNFDDLEEIAVFDLGLSEDKIAYLNSMQKVNVYRIQEENPNLLTVFHPPGVRSCLGWYAWKPVVIKEALEMFPYVVWMDAGTTVLRPLNDFFKQIVRNGYFVCTIGDNYIDGKPMHPVSWGTPAFPRMQLGLNDPANEWILSQECIMGGIVGSCRYAGKFFINDWYELTKDIRYFADDGTTPDGYGTARHDQTILSILGYLKGLHIHQQVWSQDPPMMLSLDEGEIPFYITWHRGSVSPQTSIYSSRDDLTNYNYHLSCIRFR